MLSAIDCEDLQIVASAISSTRVNGNWIGMKVI